MNTRNITIRSCGIDMRDDVIHIRICDQSPAGSPQSHERSNWKDVLIGNGWEESDRILDVYDLVSTDPVENYALSVNRARVMSGGEREHINDDVNAVVKEMFPSAEVERHVQPNFIIEAENGELVCDITLDKVDGRYNMKCR